MDGIINRWEVKRIEGDEGQSWSSCRRGSDQLVEETAQCVDQAMLGGIMRQKLIRYALRWRL